tara:strand:+ start:868 stop:1686 length:819 start_codon:yes stop_codon:yes gene_type:complete
MIIGKKFFITEMPKTGTTFLRNYFLQHRNIELTIHHETINQNKKYDLLNLKNRIGIIRNPYEWYLSIWKSTCKEKSRSPIYADLSSIRLKLRRLKLNKRLCGYIFSQINKDRNKLKSLFKNVHSKKNFNKFLDIMLNFKNRQMIGSEYSFVPFENLGYMTYIFFTQNVLRRNYNVVYNSSYKLDEIINHNNLNLYTNIFFKTENLNHNLKKFLTNNNIEIKSLNILNKNSTSNVLKKDYKNFFTIKNILLIEKKEDYIFKKFNYKKISSQFK